MQFSISSSYLKQIKWHLASDYKNKTNQNLFIKQLQQRIQQLNQHQQQHILLKHQWQKLKQFKHKLKELKHQLKNKKMWNYKKKNPYKWVGGGLSSNDYMITH